MRMGICSFSFHRTFAAGKMDICSYIQTCRDLGCTQLDPWNAHLSLAASGAETLFAGRNPSQAKLEPPSDEAFIDRVKATAAAAGLPFGCIAMDGCYIYAPEESARDVNRKRAYRWLDIAGQLGATQARIDAGGPPEMPDEAFRVIVAGYKDLIARGRDKGVEILMENHWGPSTNPDNVLKLLDALTGLHFLFDTHNWIKERQQEGWDRCASRARACHVKTFAFDDLGNETSIDLKPAFDLLNTSGFAGAWGVESVPRDGDELRGAKQTIGLIRRWGR